MATNSAVTVFRVSTNEYGWSVSVGPAQLGLFISRDKALLEVSKRRNALQEVGKASVVEADAEKAAYKRATNSLWQKAAH